jgi:hypothetical protein
VAHHVTGIFSDERAAEQAVVQLIDGHFNAEEISIVVSDRKGTHEEHVEYDTGVAEGATGGALLGGLLGALGATLIATGIVVAPGLPVFATGPLLAAFRGAVAGAAGGIGFGAVAGLGFWKDEAHIHAEALKRGGIVVGVPADHERADVAREIFKRAGAEAIRG